MDNKARLPVSKIKITLPTRRSEVVSRPRLLDSLYEQLDKKLILVAAPAGYGKTTLLIDLATNSELPICWISLDILDQEPQRFFTYLISSIANTFPAFGKESFAALENLTSFEKDGERLLVTITNEIEDKISEHFAIVLDDYHLIDPVPVIRQLVSRFMQLSGENVHLILSSRNLPDLPDLPLFISRNQATGLSFEEVAFTPEEIQQFFLQNSNQELSRQDAELLVNETEGWISAIYLTSTTTGIRPPVRPFEASSDLSDFFAREVFNKQDPSIREFLLVTSLFDTFDVSLCQDVLDPLLEEGEKREWQTLFTNVQSHNLFTVSLGVDGRWMRYHHLFQHFLQAQLHYENPTLAWHIQHQLAHYYEKNGVWEEALHLYETLADQDSLARVLDLAGPIFILSGRIVSLSNWLERVPVSTMESHPELISLQGAVYASKGDAPLAISLLSQAESKFRASGLTDRLAVALVRRAVAYRHQGRFEQALSDAEEAIFLTTGNPDNNAQYAFAEAHRVKGQALFRLDKSDKALACLEHAINLYESLGETNSIPILEMEIGVVYLARGDSQAALRYFDLALNAWDETGNLEWKAVLLNNLGVLHHTSGNFELALQTLENALYAAERSGNLPTQALTLNSLGDLLTDLQDYDQALIYNEQAIDIATQIGYTYVVFLGTLSKVRLTRLAGQPTLAESIMQPLLNNIDNVPPFQKALLDLEIGCCMLETNRAEQAASFFSSALRLFTQGNHAVEECIARLWYGTSLSQYDHKKCLSELAAMDQATCDLDISSTLIINASQAIKWLKELLQSNEISSRLKKFFEKAELFSQNLPSVRRRLRQISRRISISPPHLDIHTFGPAQVLRNEQLLNLSDWQTRETRDLFFYFLNSPPVTKEQVGAIFWPDISPARLKMRFKTNMYRLRRAVGQDVIIFQGDNYRFNRNIDYVCDREYFEELLTEASLIKQINERISRLQKAVDLVTGPYLADIDSDWVALERAHLEEFYLNALSELANDYLSTNQALQSLEISERILKVNPLLEQTYRLRMRAFSMLKDRVSITKQYQLCREILEQELGIQPSNETERLFKHLIKI
jgi:LuxR family maltose regulon positive regulatory protein